MNELPHAMLAAVYRGKDEIRLERLPLPPISPKEVLIRVEACGICGTDLKKIHLGLVEPPRIFGHEIAGRIARIGEDVEGWEVGERVAVVHHVPCLRSDCPYCRRSAFAQCPVYKQTGTTAGYEPAGGGFAEFVRVMERCVKYGMIRLPPNVTSEEASFIEPLNTCLKGVRQANIQPDDVVLILGQGPIGLLYTQLCRRVGAQVFVVDPLASRRALALQLGAEVAFATAIEAKSYLTENLSTGGADVAILAVANSHLVQTTLDLVRPAGKVLLFAQTYLQDFTQIDAGVIGMLEKQLLGSYSGDVTLLQEAADLIFRHDIEVQRLISHRLPLSSMQEAIALASQPKENTLKVIVQP
ncbi:theronine dehydrogenase-like Zn-dependent dehydrogenase [Chthonomonas calidirosea]|uniref:alcohol dehydrogenase catalytic domain-containing protein n=1 Tax=Chthonomonas calidirosea TaxID=454171 RepID=UPI0006DD44C3|nr:alcohol dehydrogenase catalytic domain-containing protein [Chthonomonas calidirosea]CEK15015.1 theronine dehydrogenase-like Zn-dependent dehydrogenase [Chthonomonas calidirosea]